MQGDRLLGQTQVGEGLPEAIRNCAWTRSTSVTSSVTVCSTWMRGFISMKTWLLSRVEEELDGACVAVADLTGEADRVRADPVAQCGVEVGRGGQLDDLLVSALQRAVALEEVDDVALAVGEDLYLDVPGSTTAFSRNTVASPNADMASRAAASMDSRRVAGSSTRRIPRPPPPATAFTNTGKPISSAARTSSSTSVEGAEEPSTGTPAARAAAMAVALLPVISRMWALGPTKVMPASSQARASSGFSERNP